MKVLIKNAIESDVPDLLAIEHDAWGDGGENIGAHSDKIKSRITSFSTGVSIARTAEGEVVGSQYAFCFDWSGEVNSLTSWDELTACGATERVHVDGGNTGFLVGVGVIPCYRGVRFVHNLRWQAELKASELLIAFTLDNLFKAGVKQVVGNARIPAYHTNPGVSVAEYCQLRREDGKLYDPVLRFHERMGAKIIKPVAYSMEDPESCNAGCWVLYQQRFAL